MNRFVMSAALICVALTTAAAGRATTEPEAAVEPLREELTFTLSTERTYEAPTGPWQGRVLGIPGAEPASGAGASIPTFTRTVMARGKAYTYTMVGSDPFAKNAPSVVVPVQIIPVAFTFPDGTVLDPTLPGPACAGGVSALKLLQQSPIFQDASYGDGDRQFVEEVRRWEFWTLTGAAGGINPGYSVRVSPTVLPTIHLSLKTFPTKKVPCGRLGFLDYNKWDSFAKRTLFPKLSKQGVTARTFPLFLFVDVVMFNGDPKHCCIAGYHSVFNSGGAQTYGAVDFDVSNAFAGSDVTAIAHELGDWYDDPFVNNETPPWAQTESVAGQAPGCQANLEVGDPLADTGHVHLVMMPNGVTYHPQELAFFSWFFDQVPSMGFDGWYSSRGFLSAPADACGTYSIRGNVGTANATIAAGGKSATSDGSGNYRIEGLAGGTYTVTPAASGCSFSPMSLSVALPPDASGENFSADCPGSGDEVVDPQTGLTWTKNDNGSDINWSDATSYCQALTLGGASDWRLASISELEALYDPSFSAECNGDICHVRLGIVLTGQNVWSETNRDPAAEWIFDFVHGTAGGNSPANPVQVRALCVRP